MQKKYFGTDGIRGRANEFPMTAESALKIGMAAGQYFKNNTKKVNTKLLSALDLGDLDGFEAALADGADPNLIPHDSDLPLVFTLAADGRLEWVEALLKTGRCDVTRTDHNGLRPSIAPGATARRLTHEETASDLRERFAAIALMLRAEESRQINRKGSDFPAP